MARWLVMLAAAAACAALAVSAVAAPDDKVPTDVPAPDEPVEKPLPMADDGAPGSDATDDDAGDDDDGDDDGLFSSRNFAGSVQLDYLAVLTEDVGRDLGLDGGTVELSLKLAMDFGEHVSSSVKVCVACHGLEVGMAYFDLRVNDAFNVRVGRFTPAFGEFPQRHDPANHRTSDKPLPYDMGRMIRLREWNMSVLPAPWVDNGIEINGTHFLGQASQVDYAVYAVNGPRASADAVDFDFIQSRSPQLYYVDNNSMPAAGARFAMTLGFGESSSLSLGLSGMGGTYDPDNELSFLILGGDASLRLGEVIIRGEYLVRRTEFALGDDPATKFRYGPKKGPDGMPGTEFDNYFLKDGFYGEVIVPVGPIDVIGRFDGMRRFGNVVATSPLRSRSLLYRSTVGIAAKLQRNLRLKVSAQHWDFSDFDDEITTHVGIAGPF